MVGFSELGGLFSVDKTVGIAGEFIFSRLDRQPVFNIKLS